MVFIQTTGFTNKTETKNNILAGMMTSGNGIQDYNNLVEQQNMIQDDTWDDNNVWNDDDN